jgi:hypothetical protein
MKKVLLFNNLGYFCNLKNLSKVYNLPIGENSPNLVALHILQLYARRNKTYWRSADCGSKNKANRSPGANVLSDWTDIFIRPCVQEWGRAEKNEEERNNKDRKKLELDGSTYTRSQIPGLSSGTLLQNTQSQIQSVSPPWTRHYLYTFSSNRSEDRGFESRGV